MKLLKYGIKLLFHVDNSMYFNSLASTGTSRDDDNEQSRETNSDFSGLRARASESDQETKKSASRAIKKNFSPVGFAPNCTHQRASGKRAREHKH